MYAGRPRWVGSPRVVGVVRGCRSGSDELDVHSTAHRLPVVGLVDRPCLNGDLDVGPGVIALPLAGQSPTRHDGSAVPGVRDADDVAVGHVVAVRAEELDAHLVGVGHESDTVVLDCLVGVVGVVGVEEALGLRDAGVVASASVDGGGSGVGGAGGGHEASCSEHRDQAG